MSYLIKNKFKSLNLLYPLLDIKSDNYINKFLKTYLYWTDGDKYENIESYCIIVTYSKEVDEFKFKKFEKENILKNINFTNCYETETQYVYIFNFYDDREVIDKFINGEYSKFKTESKNKILKYYNSPTDLVKCSLVNNKPKYPHHVVLYPHLYFEDVARELCTPGKEYEFDVVKMTESLREGGELWEKFSEEVETFTEKVTDLCHFDINKIIV